MTVAKTVDDLTPAWLESAFAAAGLPTEIDGVDVTAIGTGQIGASYRVVPTYRTRRDAPASFVVKIAAGDRAMRDRLSGGFVKEVGFYTSIASTIAARIPRCWHAELDESDATFSLVLEDMTPAVPGVQKHGCTIDRATDAIRNLAALHAPRWNDESLTTLPFMSTLDEAGAEFLQAIYADACTTFVARFSDRLSDLEARTLRDVGDVLARWQMLRPTPFSVVHGDYRLDNLMFPIAGDGVSVLDWQTVSVGPPTRDLAYFLGNSIDTAIRRERERELVSIYVEALQSHGRTDCSFEQCFEDYRLGQLQGPMITVLGCIFASAGPSVDGDEMFLTMARRSCAAISDLDSLALVAAG